MPLAHCFYSSSHIFCVTSACHVKIIKYFLLKSLNIFWAQGCWIKSIWDRYATIWHLVIIWGSIWTNYQLMHLLKINFSFKLLDTSTLRCFTKKSPIWQAVAVFLRLIHQQIMQLSWFGLLKPLAFILHLHSFQSNDEATISNGKNVDRLYDRKFQLILTNISYFCWVLITNSWWACYLEPAYNYPDYNEVVVTRKHSPHSPN